MTGTSAGNGATAKRWRRITVVVILVAGLAAIIITNEHILLQSLHTLAHLNWWWVLAALAAEAISLTAFGISRVILLRAEGDQATLGTVMSITYAGNALSMAVPFAGAQLAAVFSYRQLRGRGLGPAITSWALAVSAIVSSAALALVLLAGPGSTAPWPCCSARCTGAGASRGWTRPRWRSSWTGWPASACRAPGTPW